MSDIKTNFDIAIGMIESGEAEHTIIENENNIQCTYLIALILIKV